MMIYDIDTTQNRPQYKFLLYLSSLYIITLITTAVLFHRLILINHLVLPGGILVFPLMYFFGDAIAEIYGQSIARQVIWSALLGDLIFSTVTQVISTLPTPSNFPGQEAYTIVFSPLLHLFIISSIFMTMSSLINVSVLTRWKKLVKSRYFVLRSIGSSAISEAFLSITSIPLIFHDQLYFTDSLKLTINIYLWKLVCTILISIPGGILVRLLKIFENTSPSSNSKEKVIFKAYYDTNKISNRVS